MVNSNKYKKRFSSLSIAITIILAASFFISHIFFVRLIKENEAKIILQSNRNSILLGEQRTVVSSLTHHLSSAFMSIDVVSANGDSIVNLNDQSKTLLNPFKGEISLPIYFDPDSPQNSFGIMKFKYSLFFGIWFSISAYLFALAITLALFLREYRMLTRLSFIEQEKHFSDAIANAAQMMAHDIRKPFSLMTMSLTALNSVNSLDDMRETIKILQPEITESKVHVTRMLEDFLSFNKSKKPTLEEVDLLQFLQKSFKKSTEGLSNSIPSHEIDAPENLVVEADPYFLSRIFDNIYSNALEGNYKDGTIFTKVAAIKNPDIIEICITNDIENPMTLKETNQIFEPYFTTKTRGTGLGTLIMKKYVQLHNGSIEAKCLSKPSLQIKVNLPLSWS